MPLSGRHAKGGEAGGAAPLVRQRPLLPLCVTPPSLIFSGLRVYRFINWENWEGYRVRILNEEFKRPGHGKAESRSACSCIGPPVTTPSEHQLLDEGGGGLAASSPAISCSNPGS